MLRFSSVEQAGEEVANIFFTQAENEVRLNNSFQVAIAGGTSIKPVIERLVRNRQAGIWDKVNFFWVDERWVPFSHTESNYGNALQFGLSELNCHCIPFDTSLSNPEQSIREYEKEMKSMLGESLILDLLILGVGEDGHIASIFPQDVPTAMQADFLVTKHPITNQDRVTMSMKILGKAKQALVLIFGENKRKILEGILNLKAPGSPIEHFAFINKDFTVLTDLNENKG